jgi:hypothetical protein
MARQTKPAARRRPQEPNATAVRKAMHVAEQLPAAAVEAVEWPLSPLKYLGPWFERLQRINERAMSGLSADARIGRDDLRSAESPQELLAYQMEIISGQLARWTMINEEIVAGLLDMQGLWMRDFEALAASQMRNWLGEEAREPVRSAEAVLDLPQTTSPAEMVAAMQRAGTEFGKAWLRTLGHDLQAASPAKGRA